MKDRHLFASLSSVSACLLLVVVAGCTSQNPANAKMGAVEKNHDAVVTDKAAAEQPNPDTMFGEVQGNIDESNSQQPAYW